MACKVTKHTSGPYEGLWVAEEVPSGAILVIASTNAAAWRKVDWINAEAVSSQQDKHDWSFTQWASEE